MKIKDKEYAEILNELLKNRDILELQKYTHHRINNRLNHSIEVSYRSYRVGKKVGLDKQSLREIARAGLVHDLFFYDTFENKHSDNKVENHLKTHPEIALENAMRIFELTEKEKDIILSHMFLVSFNHVPKYKESVIVSVVDKAVSVKDVFNRSKESVKIFNKATQRAYNK